MQELEAIFWQRNGDVTQLKQEETQLKKHDYQERERARVQRENWILKVIKTIRILTADQKRKLYDCSRRMMSYYTQCAPRSEPVDLDRNFTQELINLFIQFYSECGQGDTAAVRRIVRPNNAFIIVDLLKQLVETHRQYFKVKFLERFKEDFKAPESRHKPLPVLFVRREIQLTEQSESEELPKQKAQLNEAQISSFIKRSLLQKWQNYINYSLPNEEALKSRMNDAYYELLQRNSANSFAIQKFRQKCYGRSKGFGLYIPGLYSQQEIRNIQSKLKTDAKEKFAGIKELAGNPTAEQLREYFKIQLEIQETQEKIDSMKCNSTPVNEWVPILVQRSGFQHNPLSILVMFGKDQVPLDQFQRRCGLNLKSFLGLIVKNRIQETKDVKSAEATLLKKHHFLDINHAKKRELMAEQPRVYSKEKKQSIFPILRKNEERQEIEIALKNRSLSEHKLGSLLRNEAISTQQAQGEDWRRQPSGNPIASLSNISHEPNKQRLKPLKSISSLVLREPKAGKSSGGKSKIDSIIMMILHQRNLTYSQS